MLGGKGGEEEGALDGVGGGLVTGSGRRGVDYFEWEGPEEADC